MWFFNWRRTYGPRPEDASRIWFFKWGVGIWLKRRMLGFGYETRCLTVTSQGK